MTVPTTVEHLAELVTLTLTKTQQQVLTALRGMANESGIVLAREALTNAVLNIEGAQRDLRRMQDIERTAKERLAEAMTEAEWELRDRRVAKEGAKTWWVNGEDRVQVTADEARERLAAEVRRHLAVAEAAEQVRISEEVVYEAKDRVTLAERSFSAAKHDLQAACAQLTALANTLPLVVAANERPS